jgi:hypothetical protein
MSSPPYKINGILIEAPAEGGWKERESLGIDGYGNPVLPPTRQYEMEWDYLSMTGFANIQTIYNTYGATGTVTVDLPGYGLGGWAFRTYSGAVMHEPNYDNFVEEHYENVRLVIAKIPLIGAVP